jgi:hypothetical protein
MYPLFLETILNISTFLNFQYLKSFERKSFHSFIYNMFGTTLESCGCHHQNFCEFQIQHAGPLIKRIAYFNGDKHDAMDIIQDMDKTLTRMVVAMPGMKEMNCFIGLREYVEEMKKDCFRHWNTTTLENTVNHLYRLRSTFLVFVSAQQGIYV